jgi:hypothetical protein
MGQNSQDRTISGRLLYVYKKRGQRHSRHSQSADHPFVNLRAYVNSMALYGLFGTWQPVYQSVIQIQKLHNVKSALLYPIYFVS